ncbi:MAG: hypothetical protein AAFV29_05865, partial [Myxococcota bacterium]
MEERVHQLLGQVRDQPCWSAIVGSEADFPFVLHFGEQLRRSLRLANPRLSFLQRTHEGSISLLVECAWRIDSPDRVIASCWDTFEARRDALDCLVDQNVKSMTASAPGYDLVLEMEDGHTLRCLSVETDLDRGRDNWHLYTPQALLRIGPRGLPDIRSTEEAKVAFRRLRLSLMGGDQEESPIRPRRLRPAPDPEPTDDVQDPTLPPMPSLVPAPPASEGDEDGPSDATERPSALFEEPEADADATH